MASISGNFNFPSDKGIPAKPKLDIGNLGAEIAADPKEEFVTMSGTGLASASVTGLVAAMLAENPTLPPAEVKDILIQTAKNGVVDPKAALEVAAGRSVPTTLLMSTDEVAGLGAITSNRGGDDGHGLTGLNSLGSVVASGRFSGLKGDYGPGNGFGFK